MVEVADVEVSHFSKIPEVIVSTIDVLRGQKPKEVIAKSWDKESTQLVVKDALHNLSTVTPVAISRGVYRPSSTVGVPKRGICSFVQPTLFSGSGFKPLPKPVMNPGLASKPAFQSGMFAPKPLNLTSVLSSAGGLLRKLPKF